MGWNGMGGGEGRGGEGGDSGTVIGMGGEERGTGGKWDGMEWDGWRGGEGGRGGEGRGSIQWRQPRHTEDCMCLTQRVSLHGWRWIGLICTERGGRCGDCVHRNSSPLKIAQETDVLDHWAHEGWLEDG